MNLDITDSMGPGKLVRRMQNPSYTYDEYLIYASDWDQAYRLSYAKIRRTVVYGAPFVTSRILLTEYNSVQQNTNSVGQNVILSTERNSVQQNSYSVQQNSYSVQQNSYSVQQNSYSVGQNS